MNNLLSAVCAAIMAVSSPAVASVLNYSEPADLSNDPNAPTNLGPLGVGTNTIRGFVGLGVLFQENLVIQQVQEQEVFVPKCSDGIDCPGVTIDLSLDSVDAFTVSLLNGHKIVSINELPTANQSPNIGDNPLKFVYSSISVFGGGAGRFNPVDFSNNECTGEFCTPVPSTSINIGCVDVGSVSFGGSVPTTGGFGGCGYSWEVTIEVSQVPLPASLPLLLAGIGGLGLLSRRKRKAA